MDFLDHKTKFRESEPIPELNKKLDNPNSEEYFFKKGIQKKKKKILKDKDIFVTKESKKKSKLKLRHDRKKRIKKRSDKVNRINKATSKTSKRGVHQYLSKSNPALDGTLTRRRDKLAKFVNKHTRSNKVFK